MDRLPCAGDWAILKREPAVDHVAVIERVLARRTEFTRGAAGRQTRVQAVAANVDLIFAVCGLDADFNLHRIERYVARIWASGAQPFVVLNKADIGGNGSARAAEVGRRCPGVPVFVTSALLLEGIAALRASIRDGETAAFVGSSGAGKSSLINALIGENRMPTGEVRQHDGRGCHVTTHRQLVLLPGGGLLLDTPGMRELRLVDDDGIDAVFEDVAALSARCRFRDCRHDTEPGCAVKEAVRSGAITAERLEHYRKLEHEAEASERRRDARLRRQDERALGKLCKATTHLQRLKNEGRD
jgi:ribosome biogenesis GTPase